MPVVDMNFELRPPAVALCKTTRIRAVGWAVGQDRLRVRARLAAKRGATHQRRRAANAAQALLCPHFGGCPRPCEKVRVARMGFGDEIGQPVKVGALWRVRYTRWYVFDVVCRCPRKAG